jgi:hypothetical protein
VPKEFTKPAANVSELLILTQFDRMRGRALTNPKTPGGVHVAGIKVFTAEPFHQKLSVEHFQRRGSLTLSPSKTRARRQMKVSRNRPGSADNSFTLFSVAEDLTSARLADEHYRLESSRPRVVRVAPVMDFWWQRQASRGKQICTVQDLSKRGSKRDVYICHLYRSWHVGQRP